MSDTCPFCLPITAWGGNPEMFESLKKWHDANHPPKAKIEVSGLVGARPLATTDTAKKPQRPNNTTDTEHYLRAGEGTQTACSCGKSFGFSSDATQHIGWQLHTQKLLAQEANKAVLAALAKHVLAGMPELTPRQQDYIMRVFEKLIAENKHAQGNDLVASDPKANTDVSNPPTPAEKGKGVNSN